MREVQGNLSKSRVAGFGAESGKNKIVQVGGVKIFIFTLRTTGSPQRVLSRGVMYSICPFKVIYST